MSKGTPVNSTEQTLFKYDLALILVTFIWGTTFVIAKDLIEQTPPLNYLSARFLVAAVVLCLISRSAFRNLKLKTVKAGATLGLFIFGGFFAQAVGLNYTTPSKSAFVTGVSVILVPFFGYLLARTRITAEHLFAVLLASLGFGLITIPKENELINIGDISTLIGTIFWALHIVKTGIYVQRFDGRQLLLVQIVTAASAFIISYLVMTTLGIWPFFANQHWPINLTVGAQLGYLATMATIGTIMVQTRVQRYLSATRAAIIFSLEPAFASLVSYLVRGELLSWRTVAGGGLIVVAIIVSEVKFFGERAASRSPAVLPD